MREKARAVPAWAWLGALVAVSTAVRFGFARHMVGPWIMIDEIVYSELAKSFAASGSFAVREVPTGGYGVVYPILISPAYALFRSIPTVYSAIKLINALLMSLTAVPAYLLARRVVSKRGALVVSLLTVAVPSTFYAGTIMTENAFYPIFMVVALALVTLLERPRLATVLFFLGALALAYETRAQAVAVLAAALVAPLVIAALARSTRELLGYKLLYAAIGGIAVLVVLAELVRGRSISSLLGAYAAATHSSYDVGVVARWLLWHLSELDLYVGFVPFFALVLLCVQGKALSAAERAVRRCDRLAGRAACRRGRRVRVATERRAHRGAQSLLRRAAPLHLSGALDRARDAAAARGGRGCRSRCRRACRGSPLRAVHQHISDVRTRSACSRSGPRHSGCVSRLPTSGGWSQEPRRCSSSSPCLPRGGSGGACRASCSCSTSARFSRWTAGRSEHRSGRSSRGSRSLIATGSRRSSAPPTRVASPSSGRAPPTGSR